ATKPTFLVVRGLPAGRTTVTLGNIRTETGSGLNVRDQTRGPDRRMKTDFIAAINQVSSEKGVSKEIVIEAIEAALVSAYKRNFGGAANQDVVVRINRQTGDVRVFIARKVVEEVADPRIEVTLAEARE